MPVVKEKTETASTAVAKGEDLVTVSFKCTQKEKSDLLTKATDGAGVSLSEYVRYKALKDETPPTSDTLEPIVKIEVATDEEIEAYERLISKLRNENYDLKFELHTYKNIKLGESEKDTKILSLTSELEQSKLDAIENVPFVKEFLDWSKTDEGKKILSENGEDAPIDLSQLNDRLLLLAILDMGIDYTLPGKRLQSRSNHIKWILKEFSEKSA